MYVKKPKKTKHTNDGHKSEWKNVSVFLMVKFWTKRFIYLDFLFIFLVNMESLNQSIGIHEYQKGLLKSPGSFKYQNWTLCMVNWGQKWPISSLELAVVHLRF